LEPDLAPRHAREELEYELQGDPIIVVARKGGSTIEYISLTTPWIDSPDDVRKLIKTGKFDSSARDTCTVNTL
jgi:hypothetical protein